MNPLFWLGLSIFNLLTAYVLFKALQYKADVDKLFPDSKCAFAKEEKQRAERLQNSAILFAICILLIDVHLIF